MPLNRLPVYYMYTFTTLRCYFSQWVLLGDYILMTGVSGFQSLLGAVTQEYAL